MAPLNRRIDILQHAHVVRDPAGAGPGHWAGAPGVFYDRDERAFYLTYRLRRPRGVDARSRRRGPYRALDRPAALRRPLVRHEGPIRERLDRTQRHPQGTRRHLAVLHQLRRPRRWTLVRVRVEECGSKPTRSLQQRGHSSRPGSSVWKV